MSEVLNLFQDFSRVPQDALEQAQERGSQLHEIFAVYARGLWVPPVGNGLQPYYDSFRHWFDKTVIRVACVEIPLIEPALRFTGTPDIICELKGDDFLALGDWKSSQVHSPIWRMQTAAYRKLAIYNGYEIGKVFTLRPSKEGKAAKFKDYPQETWELDFYTFTAALQVYNFLKGAK